MNETLTKLAQAVELNQVGEDGSGYLSLVLGDFELAQLWATSLSAEEHEIVKDAQELRRVIARAS